MTLENGKILFGNRFVIHISMRLQQLIFNISEYFVYFILYIYLRNVASFVSI